MAFDGDPYRALGLARGASLEEVKRAYRRLAKANHPDAAGSGALPRFLAIQAAYELLIHGSDAAGSKPRGSSNGVRSPSEADPDRTDATRRAYGGRARTRGTTDESAGRRRPRGSAPGAPGGGDGARRRSTGVGDAGPEDPESARRRGKATLGSTSYDGADTGPDEPDWSGASWYGTTSGTYWTLNPKEYADPRKHGPEYQARARRAGSEGGDAREAVGGASGPAAPASGPAAARGPGTARDPDAGDTTAFGSAETTSTTPGLGANRRSDRPGRAAGPGHTASSWWDSTSGLDEGVEGSHAAGSAWRQRNARATAARASAADDVVPDPARALANLARALTDPRAGGSRGRVIRAFVGWLPIALGLGWLLGELTGCGRFAATCDPGINPLILLIQGAVLVALLLLPVGASIAAGAAMGLVVAAVAATLILSATGTSPDEGSRRATLGALLVVGWLAGLAVAIAQRLRSSSSRVRPVS